MKSFITLLTLTLLFQSVESYCNRFKNCFACTQHKIWSLAPCQWCPLTSLCKSKLSFRNDCLKKQNIRNIDHCVSRFHGKTKHYSPSVAFHLAKFAAISYSDVPGQCMARIFPEDDYVIEKTILKACDDYYFDYDKKCSAIIAKSDSQREIIVAIRGSRGAKQVLDQILTIMTKYTAPFPTGGKVQEYFMNVNNKLYPDIKTTLYDLLKTHPGYEVQVTGHSLGGTVASLTSALLIHDKIVKPDQLLLYTFGMPRVGDKVYALNHDKIVTYSWRVVRDGDFVSRLPTCFHGKCSLFNGPYHHRTKVLYTGSVMKMYSNYIICKGNEDSTSKCRRRQRYRRGLSSLGNRHLEYFGIRIGQYCRDHIMTQ